MSLIHDEEVIRTRVNILKESELFKSTPDETLERIADVLEEIPLKPQEIVFRKGDEGDSMYIIVRGLVRVHDGDHVLLRMGPGKAFGEYALFDRETRSASVTAEEKSLLLQLKGEDFYDFLLSDLDVVKGALAVLIKRIREMNVLEGKLAKSYIKISKQKKEIEDQKASIESQKAELENVNAELRITNKEKDKLFSVFAHDLRNPLTSSLCLADLLKSFPENMSTDQLKSVEVIDNSLNRINSIINHILDINTIEAPALSLTPEETRLSLLVRKTYDIFRYTIAQKNLEVHFELDAALSAAVDRNYLALVLENLLSNAIKFSPRDKELWIKLLQKGEKVRIEIVDQGPGIDEENQQKLMGTYQAKIKESENNGSGLSIVKKYVEAMKGSVWCEINPGEGSTIILEFDAL